MNKCVLHDYDDYVKKGPTIMKTPSSYSIMGWNLFLNYMFHIDVDAKNGILLCKSSVQYGVLHQGWI